MRAASCAALAAALAAPVVSLTVRAGTVAAPHVIRVDVIASDARGRIIDNLKPADFVVTENASPQRIEAVQFVRTDGRPPSEGELKPIRSEFDEQEEAARQGTRLFALFLDEYHVSPANAGRARDVLTAFVDRDLGPRDLVAVLKPLDSLLTIRMTRDPAAVRHAIDTFGGRKGDYEPRNAFEREFIAGAPARIDQIRAQVATSALNALVVHLGKLNEGRKSVLLVSEGFSRPSRRRGLEGLPTIDSVVRSASRYNVSVYAFNPQKADDDEPASDDRPADAATLKTLADGTDGRAAGDDQPLRQMASDASAYYLLTYQSSQPDDGKFRDVDVRVNRTGVRLRARKGYWGLWPDEARAAELLARANEPVHPPTPAPFLLPWHSSPLIRPWFGISRGDAGRTRVTFAWEPAPRVPGDRSRVAPPARIMISAFAPDGTELFHGPVCAASAASCDAARAVFDVAPGRVRLQMAIEDASDQVIDSDVREIAVRDLKNVALGTAEIIRTRTAREFRVVASDPVAHPAAVRDFSRTEHLIVRVAAYAPDASPRVAIHLANRLGQTLRDLPVTKIDADGRFQADVELASLAPGEYFFELAASSSAGEAKDLIGFRVTN